MKPTEEQLRNLTEHIIRGMSYLELIEYVYDDIYHIMDCDNEVFWLNLEHLDMKPEDLNER
jgi:hypothetical protein